jgi:hypothetical protein
MDVSRGKRLQSLHRFHRVSKEFREIKTGSLPRVFAHDPLARVTEDGGTGGGFVLFPVQTEDVIAIAKIDFIRRGLFTDQPSVGNAVFQLFGESGRVSAIILFSHFVNLQL